MIKDTIRLLQRDPSLVFYGNQRIEVILIYLMLCAVYTLAAVLGMLMQQDIFLIVLMLWSMLKKRSL